MTEANLGPGSPIKEFITDLLKQSEAAFKENGYTTTSERDAHAVLELNATQVKEAGGGFKVYIFRGEGKIEDANTQKATFFVKKENDADAAEEEFRKVNALAKRKMIEENSGVPFEMLNHGS